MLRPEFVGRKLDLILDELERIVVRAIDVNEHLIASLAASSEVARSRLSYRESFLRLVHLGVYDQAFAEAIAPSAGLRNILVHEYNDVDHTILYGAIGTTLELYRDYVSAVHAFLQNRAGGQS